MSTYIQLNQSYKAIINVPGSLVGDAITYTIYTSAGATFASGTPTYIAGTAWSVTFTPTTVSETYIVEVVDATVPLTVTETYTSVGVIGAVWDAVSGATGSAVGVANIALSKIGAQRIVSMTEATENARIINAIYGTIRDEVLRAHPWNFAIKRIAPALYYSTPDAWATATVYGVGDYVLASTTQYRCLIAHTSGTFSTDLAAGKWVADTAKQVVYEYACSHTIPADCLRVIDITDGTRRIEDYKIENGLILSDYDIIYIRYIYRIVDTTKFDANFISCFAIRLAAELAFPITGKGDLAKLLKEEYAEEIRKAKAIDGQESGMPDESGKDYFIESRF